MTDYTSWPVAALTAGIADRSSQLARLQDAATQMIQQIEMAEFYTLNGAGEVRALFGKMDAEGFVRQAMSDAEADLKDQLREMRYELREREMAGAA